MDNGADFELQTRKLEKLNFILKTIEKILNNSMKRGIIFVYNHRGGFLWLSVTINCGNYLLIEV